MNDHVNAIPPAPKEIVRRAHAVFGSNNFYLRVGGDLETILDDIRLSVLLDVHPCFRGPVPVLAMVTFFQYVEGLHDMQAADALRTRIDWQYALHLTSPSPLLDPDGLCAYRQTLLFDAPTQREFQRLLDRLSEYNPPAEETPPGLTAMQVLTSVCTTNRVKWVYDASHALVEALAAKSPLWLGEIALPHWYALYHGAVATSAGTMSGPGLATDALYLITTVHRSGAAEIAQFPEVVALDTICREQLDWTRPDDVQFLTMCRFCATSSPRGSREEDSSIQTQSNRSDRGSGQSRATAQSSGG